MNANVPWMTRRVRISGVLLVLSLIVEAASLHWSHPTAFLVFIFVGGLLMAVGILVYLYSLLPVGSAPR